MSKLRGTWLGMLAAMFAAVLAAPAMAHEGHHGPITKDVAIQRGKLQIEKLVTNGKLEGFWSSKATLKSAELREAGKAKEWELVYTNPAASKADQRTLYVIPSESGRYLSVDLKGS